MTQNSYRKGRDFAQALKMTERTRRLLGLNRQTDDIGIVLEYFHSIIELTSPPHSRYPLLTRQEAAFLISDLINSRLGIEDDIISSICVLASELELPLILVADYQQKWLRLTGRIEQLQQIYQGIINDP